MKEKILLKLLMVFSVTFITVLLCGYFSIIFLTLSFVSLGSYIKYKQNKKSAIVINNENEKRINNDYKTIYYPNHSYGKSKKLIKKKVKY